MLIALLISIAVVKAVIADPIDPDFFWHIRVADQLIARGIGPVPDPFSFMSKPGSWTPFSWLGELAMRRIFDAGGLRGVVGVHALCSSLFLFFIALTSLEATRQLNGERRRVAAALAVAFGMMLSLSFLSFRPVTMALALMSAMNWLLWRDRRVADRPVWLLVPLTVVLTNLHLYVILFVVALWAMSVGMWADWLTSQGRGGSLERRAAATRWTILSVLCSLAACCTPMLPGCIRNAIWFNGQDPMVIHELVAEILPFYSGPLGKVLLALVIGLLALAVRERRRLGWANLFALAAALVFLFQMGRFASVFAILACPIAAVVLPRMRDNLLARPILRVTMIASLVCIAANVAIHFPRGATTMDAWLTRNGDADNLLYPTAAATFVDEHVPRVHGRVLNELTWGGYLIWRLGDRYQVFMDGRTLIYPAAFWNDLYVNGDATKIAILREQQADAAILPTRKSALREPLKSLGWTEIYRDDRAVVLRPPTVVGTARD